MAPTSDGYRRRIETSAEAVAGYLDEYVDEVETRDALILGAIDAGIERREVARWARLSPTRVTQVVARRAAELQHAPERED